MRPLERVRELAERVASGYGLDIFDVELKREGGQQILRVVVDRPGPAARPEESVSIDDCARVAEDLGTLLDVEDVIPTEYTFEVSSPGLDRPLRTADDYRRSGIEYLIADGRASGYLSGGAQASFTAGVTEAASGDNVLGAFVCSVVIDKGLIRP